MNKEKVINHKKQAIKKINTTFEAFINKDDAKYLKKVDLISYWLEDYSKYLLDETNFNYKALLRFKRGDVILVNFGFNVGSEHGGLHYAIVLDNNNKHSSPVITVLPLSSNSGKQIYENDIDLGNELYDKLNNKFILNKSEYEAIVKENDEKISQLQKAKDSILNSNKDVDVSGIEEVLEDYVSKKLELNKEEKLLNIYEKEVTKLKNGSIALLGQITTVSKMRIYKPKNKNDLLYNITFSDGAMDKINEQLKKLYIFSK